MAVTLNVTFSDAEEARLTPAVAALLPGLTPLQRRTALEAEAKRMLIDRIKRLVRDQRTAALKATVTTEQNADDAALVASPSPFEPTP